MEIALRAISPGINDPHTAINCINRIGRIMVDLTKKQQHTSNLYDKTNQLRVMIQQHDIEFYLYKGFYQIRYYSKEDVSVTTAIIRVFQLIALKASPSFKQYIWIFANDILNGFNSEVLLPFDKDFLEKERRELARITGNDIDK